MTSIYIAELLMRIRAISQQRYKTEINYKLFDMLEKIDYQIRDSKIDIEEKVYKKNIRKQIMKGLFVVFIAVSFIGGCSYVNRKLNVKDDWVGEEFLEAQIEQQSGIIIDLTPNSPENS